MKKQINLTLSMLLIFFMATMVSANSFQGEQNVNITTEATGNLYLAGQNVIVDAPIRGDLICAAADIVVRDSVLEDVVMVGGTLKLMGVVGDDVRVAGGTITVLNNVNGDLIIAGGDVIVGKDVVVKGNLQLVGGTLQMDGRVLGTSNIRGGEIFWNGIAEKEISIKSGELTFNGTASADAELAATELSIGNNAQFFSDVNYWNEEGVVDFGNALAGGANSIFNEDLAYGQMDFDWRYLGVGAVLFWIYRLLTAALIIGLLIWMFHRFFYRNSLETSQNYGKHLGYGALYVLGIPILIILAFVTIIGIPVGFLLMFLYGMTIAFGHILASVLIAYGLDAYYKKNWNRRNIFFVAISSYLALKIIGIIPLLGFLVSLIIVTIAIGTLLQIWRDSRPSKSYQTIE